MGLKSDGWIREQALNSGMIAPDCEDQAGQGHGNADALHQSDFSLKPHPGKKNNQNGGHGIDQRRVGDR